MTDPMSTYESDREADNHAKYGWQRSAKGNLTRLMPDGRRITIFSSGDGWGYCIAFRSKPTFSNHFWPTEEDAMDAALEAIEK